MILVGSATAGRFGYGVRDTTGYLGNVFSQVAIYERNMTNYTFLTFSCSRFPIIIVYIIKQYKCL